MKEILKKNFPNLTLCETILFLVFAVIFIIFTIAFFTIKILNAESQIDPLAFLGTIAIGIVSILFVRQQNKISELQNEISRTGLEQMRPRLKISTEYSIDENIPYLRLLNVGETEAENIQFFAFNEKDKTISPIKEYNNISLDIENEILIPLKCLNRSDYQTIFIIYKNVLTGRNYILANNINFNAHSSKSILPVGMDFWGKGDIYPIKSPFSASKYMEIKVFLSENLYKKEFGILLQNLFDKIL